jgi:hypothetical protein
MITVPVPPSLVSEKVPDESPAIVKILLVAPDETVTTVFVPFVVLVSTAPAEVRLVISIESDDTKFPIVSPFNPAAVSWNRSLPRM